jgi:hypothetical protein
VLTGVGNVVRPHPLLGEPASDAMLPELEELLLELDDEDAPEAPLEDVELVLDDVLLPELLAPDDVPIELENESVADELFELEATVLVPELVDVDDPPGPPEEEDDVAAEPDADDSTLVLPPPELVAAKEVPREEGERCAAPPAPP